MREAVFNDAAEVSEIAEKNEAECIEAVVAIDESLAIKLVGDVAFDQFELWV